MNRYRRQTIRMRTDHHDVDGEPVEIAIPFYMAGLMAAFHKLLDTPYADKTDRMKQLQELMWQTIIEDWGISKWDWRTSWYVVGFEPLEES